MRKKNKNNGVESEDSIRQVSISNLNLAVNLASSNPNETIEYLCKKSLEIMEKLKDGE